MNYYERLDIAKNADKPSIKRAYFTKVKRHTPDNDPAGFKAVREAYETLMDDKKRREYDEFLLGAQSNDILTARDLMKRNSYKEAVNLLSAKLEENPNDVAIKRMLAESLMRIRKTGKAETLCKEILDDNPVDVDAWVLRGQIAHSRGHNVKAQEYFKTAIANAKTKRDKIKAWSGYLSYVNNEIPFMYRSISAQAIVECPDVFQENYMMYLQHVYEADDIEADGAQLAGILDSFVKYFLADKNMAKECYDATINSLAHVCNSDDLMPAVIKLYPALESSRFRDKAHETDLTKAYAYIAHYRLRTDSDLHPLLCDLTVSILDSDFDANKEDIEAVIVTHLPQIRKSIKKLRDNYAEYYKLNANFYMTLLDSSKAEYLHDKYAATLRKFASLQGGDAFEADDDFIPQVPITRESPKIGRNEPCPCGSGKKYKRCCG
ncbi:MAG: DnaJ domain-containing protein [Defluviitaleaceae bacterium]|nr:DnaJ domain-containing protein [Defluviitaleaceae bacterium]